MAGELGRKQGVTVEWQQRVGGDHQQVAGDGVAEPAADAERQRAVGERSTVGRIARQLVAQATVDLVRSEKGRDRAGSRERLARGDQHDGDMNGIGVVGHPA